MKCCHLYRHDKNDIIIANLRMVLLVEGLPTELAEMKNTLNENPSKIILIG